MDEELMMNEELQEEYYPEPKRGIKGKIIGGVLGAAVVGGGIYLATKGKQKLEEHKIKTLEKKGYIVCKPEFEELDEVYEDDSEE